MQSVSANLGASIVCVPAHEQWEVPNGPGTRYDGESATEQTGDTSEWFVRDVPAQIEAKVIAYRQSVLIGTAFVTDQQTFEGNCNQSSVGWGEAVEWIEQAKRRSYIHPETIWADVDEWLPTEIHYSSLPALATLQRPSIDYDLYCVVRLRNPSAYPLDPNEGVGESCAQEDYWVPHGAYVGKIS